MAKVESMFWGAMPHALYQYFKVDQPKRLRLRQEAERLRRPLELSGRNAELRHRHQGQRCFILCNGPSVKRQDITILKGEHVFSVSSGYHHPDYPTLDPIYHFVPQLTYGQLTREDAIDWFREMDGRIGRATLFLNYTEEALVRDCGLFKGRDVRYVAFAGTFEDYDPFALPDISKRIAGVQSVAIMCLMAAMYMGFTEIYLLGTDHDHFRTGEYTYFYEPTLLRGKDPSTDSSGNIVGSLYDELAALKVLWEQYRWIKRVAGHHGIRIFNASAGGALDEFPRMDLTAAAASGSPGTR